MRTPTGRRVALVLAVVALGCSHADRHASSTLVPPEEDAPDAAVPPRDAVAPDRSDFAPADVAPGGMASEAAPIAMAPDAGAADQAVSAPADAATDARATDAPGGAGPDLAAPMACGSDGGAASAATAGTLDGLVPLPRLVRAGTGAFVLTAATKIVAGPAEVAPVAQLLAERVRAATGFPLELVAAAPASGPHIDLALDATIVEDEGYRLDVQPAAIAVRARTAHGLFDGVQTLRQLFPAAVEGTASAPLSAPAVHIEDAPRFRYRGLMLDTSRHFFPVPFLLRLIDLAALYKIDVLHWHLTDDQGWRLEIKKYPQLTKVGAYRDDGNGGRYGDFYTQDQVRQVVAYAAQRFVTVMPEIEMPGHAQAALSAYPQYSCTGGPFTVKTTWGGSDAVFCPSEETFQFLTDVLTEVAALFPGPFIHVGGDEVRGTAWANSPVAQAVMQREGLTTTAQLQAYFTKRIAAAAKPLGRRILGWDDILNANLDPTAVIMNWHGVALGQKAAVQGIDAVMSPAGSCYLDHYQADPATEPQAHGGNQVTLATVYAFNPLPAGLTAAQAPHILGPQANLWTEYVPTTSHAEYMMFPRALALAEVGWSTLTTVDYAGFVTRLRANLPRLDVRCVNYARHF
jgi:hexosaminidase